MAAGVRERCEHGVAVPVLSCEGARAGILNLTACLTEPKLLFVTFLAYIATIIAKGRGGVFETGAAMSKQPVFVFSRRPWLLPLLALASACGSSPENEFLEQLRAKYEKERGALF